MSLSEVKSTMLETTSIETIVNPGNAVETTEVRNNNPVLTSVFEGNQVLTTHNTVPQVETVIQPDKTYLTSVIYGNWEVVWSVNGQTGDVTIDVVIGEFIPNNVYRKGAAILYDNVLYAAIEDFTAGQTFDPTQWTKIKPKADIVFGIFEPNHHYYARQSIWRDDSIYVANEEFTSGNDFDPDDWTQMRGAGDITYEDGTIVITTAAQHTATSSFTNLASGASQDTAYTQLLNKIYPVGAIFTSATMSTSSEVGAALGGTWEALANSSSSNDGYYTYKRVN